MKTQRPLDIVALGLIALALAAFELGVLGGVTTTDREPRVTRLAT